jgi:hypothetical protein
MFMTRKRSLARLVQEGGLPRDGRNRICRDNFHEGQSEIEQLTTAKYVGRRFYYAATVVPGLDEKTVDDLCEKAIWPVWVSAVAGGIELSSIARHTRHPLSMIGTL